MAPKEMDFYKVLRSRINNWLKSGDNSKYRWGNVLLLAPDLFHLAYKLSTDPDVPARERAKMAGVLAYFISPIDLLPEAILGPIGFIDDVALAAYALNGLINNVGPDVVRKHWSGDDDILEVIQKILETADRMLGRGIWKRIKKRF
jgi:uncharacterized membrane protein YkvA (DUF1232 family)